MSDIETLFSLQKKNRWNFSATSAQERIALLKTLRKEILKRREEIKSALYLDFKKPYAESELTEIHTVLDEINFTVRNLKSWMRPLRVRTPLALFGTHSEIHYEARGVVLILSPWNYPFSLLLNPLVAAIAAGNCVIARPSEKTPHTAKILTEIVSAVFKRDVACVVTGDIDLAEKILELPFDHIFFTGSTSVGKKVMAAAAKNLSTVTLELGGKSPAIIDQKADLDEAVKALAWGKYLNGGQTCVAPDYVFIPREQTDAFLQLFRQQILNNFGLTEKARRESKDYARLIDRKSFERLKSKIQSEKSVFPDEAQVDGSYLPPIAFEASLMSPIMEEEIFGPVLPVIAYDHLDEALEYIRSREKPLALYVFSRRNEVIKKILTSTSSGGVVVNNVIIHLANPYLPFGGTGDSGQGSYHGHFGFKAFSHEKALLIQGKLNLIKFYYPPYNRIWSKLAFKLLRFLE